MLSTMDFVELEVLRMMSAPPAAARFFPSRTISSAPSSRINLSLSGEWEMAMVSKAADSKHGHALVRLGIGPAQPAVDRVARAEDRSCLFVGNLVGDQIGCVGIHQHVLGVTALCLNSCALHVGTEHSATTLAPFAAAAGGLNPSGTHAVAHLPRRDVGSHGNDLAYWLMAQDSGKWSGKVPECQMYVGVADAA